MKANLRMYLFPVLVIFILSSCSSYKKIPYLQSPGDPDSLSVIVPKKHRGTIRLRPEDQLNISVLTPREPDGAKSFNLIDAATAIGGGIAGAQSSALSYLVDSRGNIEFPILGTLHVQGMTKEELENDLKERLKTYIREEPIVTVSLLNFEFYTLGETGANVHKVNKEKINLLEALAMSGDLNHFGKRDRIMLIREQANGEYVKVRLDISDVEIMRSPYFYLQQNDIIYAEHNKANAGFSTITAQTSFWMSMASILTTAAVLVISFTK